MALVFGPVPSRRLGNSLGISPIPLKTCNYSCIYCQLGKTTNFTNERREYYPVDRIISELEKTVGSATLPIDFITFVGDGEPTLNSGIGRVIMWIVNHYNYPIAVITNGFLLYQNDVRKDLMPIDVLMPSIDAPDEKTFRLINRPVEPVPYDTVIDGLRQFASSFEGQIWVEVMLVKGVNDSDESLNGIASIIESIEPLPPRVYINTPVRPPAEGFALEPDEDRIKAALDIIPNALSIAMREEGDFDVSIYSSALEAILDITEKHPLRQDQAKMITDKFDEMWDKVRMELEKYVRFFNYDDEVYLLKIPQK